MTRLSPATPAHDPVRLGVSSCLLGNKVRYDGQHKRDALLVETVGPLVELVPICPEVEVGMGIPRPTVRLVQVDGDVRMIAEASGDDWTDRMRAWAAARVAALAEPGLDGCVLKKSSPSCGRSQVKLFRPRVSTPARSGVGLFAAELQRALPGFPVEDEERLDDPGVREAFFERVFAWRRLRRLFASGWTLHDVIEFHAREKMLLLAHSPDAYRALGPLVARARELPRAELERSYRLGLLDGLAVPATVGRHTNVLEHVAGYFKDLLPAEEKAELQRVIADYRARRLPLVVPITLLRHQARRFDIPYLVGQTYLEPSPGELLLRNHA